jgi:hypothetical protein
MKHHLTFLQLAADLTILPLALPASAQVDPVSTLHHFVDARNQADEGESIALLADDLSYVGGAPCAPANPCAGTQEMRVDVQHLIADHAQSTLIGLPSYPGRSSPPAPTRPVMRCAQRGSSGWSWGRALSAWRNPAPLRAENASERLSAWVSVRHTAPAGLPISQPCRPVGDALTDPCTFRSVWASRRAFAWKGPRRLADLMLMCHVVLDAASGDEEATGSSN